jgi:taurine dioxygenase
MGSRTEATVLGDVRHEPLTTRIGSVVTGVDFSTPESVAAAGEQLRALLLERQVIFFRGVPALDPAVQEALGGVFGKVQPVGELMQSLGTTNVGLLRSNGTSSNGTDIWHVDRSWYDSPPSATCLYAVKIPPIGGDTLFSSMTYALESLDPEFREYVSGLSCLHSWESEIHRKTLGDERFAAARVENPPKLRPVVEHHPVSGKPILYVNGLYTTKIVGIPPAQSEAILRYLTDLASVPDWQVRWRWEPGSIAIWDNWAVQHYAVADYYPHERVMHRVTAV